MGLRFTVVRPSDVKELLGGAAPDVVAMQNAQRKARAVADGTRTRWSSERHDRGGSMANSSQTARP